MPARQRGGRPVHGILLLDKPKGLGSNEMLQTVKRLLKARKAGHTGSLDRLASGLLPLCFGEATKLSSFLLNADKRYVARFRLGATTTTGDAEGDVVQERPLGSPTLERLRATLDEFVGEITQVPPMFSALKHKGQRLYKLAHQGVVVEREPRCVTIRELELLSWSPPRTPIVRNASPIASSSGITAGVLRPVRRGRASMQATGYVGYGIRQDIGRCKTAKRESSR